MDLQHDISHLNEQFSRLCEQGPHEQAREVALRLENLIRQHTGNPHPDIAASLTNLALLYHEQGDYDTAEPYYLQALEQYRRTLGMDHPNVAITLTNLGTLYRLVGNTNAATTRLQQALAIRRQTFSSDSLAIARSLNHLAEAYREQGNYTAAEPLYQEALQIRRKALGKRHPDVAHTLNDLGLLYRAVGDYEAALSYFRQALDLTRQASGENTKDYASTLNNLAELLHAMGEYTEAAPTYHRALDIMRRIDGEGHASQGTLLNNLALLYEDMGDYEKAASHYQQALEVTNHAFGDDHPFVATCLNNMAALCHTIGNDQAALSICQRALEATRRIHGEAHPEFARSLNNLAVVYRDMEDFETAGAFYKQALETTKQAFEQPHPFTAVCLNNLAEWHRSTADYERAEPLYQEALDIYRQTFGEEHPDFALIQSSLAQMYVTMGRETEGLALLEHTMAVGDRVIGQMFSIGSERQRMAYLQTLHASRGGLDVFLSLVLQYFSHVSQAVHAGMEVVLRRKAIGAEALAIQRTAILGGRYAALEPKLRELCALQVQIAQKTLAGPGAEGVEQHQKTLQTWHTQLETLETELAHEIPEMRLDQQMRTATCRTIAEALPNETVLVEFVRFDRFDFNAVPARGEAQWRPAHYLAFMLPAGEPDHVQMIDLGEADSIDRLIDACRTAITGRSDGDKRHLGAVTAQHDHPIIPAHGKALRHKIFDVLEASFNGYRQVFLAPDGDLARLPFEVLPTDDGHHLLNTYQFRYLSTGRDILRFGMASMGLSTPPMIVADPDFDLKLNDIFPRRKTIVLTALVQKVARISWVQHLAHVVRSLHGSLMKGMSQASIQDHSGLHRWGPTRQPSRDLRPRDLSFGRLPGTRTEGERIAAMFNVHPLLGRDVLETRLKACRSPCILHIATHGFFLPNQVRAPRQERPGTELSSEMGSSGLGRLSSQGLENPLLRSGLALAGANTWLARRPLPEEAEDGILTALDVSGLDLSSTELVVLSACETGLGDIHVGEGVFGLRRAFALAGAKTLVMSLWNVPDWHTQTLMEEFYRRILEGKPRAAALREAQLAMQSKAPDPYYWGAFICQGEPGPLP